MRSPNDLIDLFTAMRSRVFEHVGTKVATELACGCDPKKVAKDKEKASVDER